MKKLVYLSGIVLLIGAVQKFRQYMKEESGRSPSGEDATRDKYTGVGKEALVSEFEKRKDATKERLDELNESLEKVESGDRRKFSKRIASLEGDQKRIELKIRDFKKGDEVDKDLKSELDKAFVELNEAIQEMDLEMV